MKLPRDVSGAEAIKALERLGFSTIRQTGSHVRMAQGNRRTTVPMHRKLVVGTLATVIRGAREGGRHTIYTNPATGAKAVSDPNPGSVVSCP